MNKAYIFFAFLLCFFQGMLKAQSSVSFGYDNAGNRVSRVIVLGLRSAQEEDTSIEAVYSEVLQKIEIRIYPNPTEGLLKVDIQNLPEKQTASIHVYNLSGRLLLTKKGISGITDIDLSEYPAGTYLLKIIAGEEQTEWKIIKK